MSFQDSTLLVPSRMTHRARQLHARSGIVTIAYKIVGFSVGTGGYDVTNPVKALAVDGTSTALANQVYPIQDEATFEFIEDLGTVKVFNCRLPAVPSGSDADYGLGEIGLWAEVIHSEDTVQPDGFQVGEKFLYALAHRPLISKTYKDVFLFRVLVNYGG